MKLFLKNNCGHFTFTVPTGIAPGNYLVRAEVIALHVASSVGGAQYVFSIKHLKADTHNIDQVLHVMLPSQRKAHSFSLGSHSKFMTLGWWLRHVFSSHRKFPGCLQRN